MNFLSEQEDMDTMLRGVDTAKRIAGQKPLAGWGNKPLAAAARTDEREAIEKWVRGATMTTFHYCGTCRMGDDESSPVDTRLKLRGLANVRIADASAIPEIPVSALNAPSMLVAWRDAKFIVEDTAKAIKGEKKKPKAKTNRAKKSTAKKQKAEKI